MSRLALSRLRYGLALGFLVVWAGAYARHGVWYGDFWSHAAVIRELSIHPTDPHHPQLLLDVPHPFLSPYAWLLGIVAKATGASAVGVLAAAGVLNALLLGLAVLWFCRTLFPRRAWATAFWSLVLIVFWWGDSEWFWSGFVHAGVFGYVASYPSTAALICGLSVLSLTPRWLAGSAGAGASVLLLLTAILLMHPLTAIFAVVGMSGLAFARWPELGWRGAWIPLALLLAIGVASRWPLYPFFDLFTTENGEFHQLSRVLYENLWTRTYPLVLTLPLVLARVRRHRRDALVWSIVGLLAVYGIGYLTGRYGLGRVVSPIAILVQIGLAAELARLEQRLNRWPARMAYAVGLVLIVWVAAKADGPVKTIFEARTNNYAATKAILEEVGDDEVVMANLATGWLVPAFGPRIVATDRPQYWVDDHRRRREDVARFFDPSTADTTRRTIVERYDVSYVLVKTSEDWSSPAWLAPARETPSLRLLKVLRPSLHP